MFARQCLVLGIILGAGLFGQYSCFEIKGIVNKVVPTSIQCFFHSKASNFSQVHCDRSKVKEDKSRERGNFDSFGRDIIKDISNKVSEVTEEFQVKTSNATGGLDCNRTFFGHMADGFKKKVRAIYPGTKWCGDGDISESYDDLGRYYGTDSCCREHDLCPDSIASDQTKYGLVNTGLFTRSHCSCDRKFYECLKNVGSVLSKSIGFTYFSVLGPQCFDSDYPIVGCEQRKKNKCVKYKRDLGSAKTYQWFDSPTF